MSIQGGIALRLSGLAAGALLSACILGGKPWSEHDVYNGAYTQFKQRCSICHGMVGTGGLPPAPSLKNNKFLAEASIEEIKEVIIKGRVGGTLPFPEYLTDEEITAIKSMSHTKWIKNIGDAQMDGLAEWLKRGMPMR